MTESTPLSIWRVANELIDSAREERRGATVFLGAGASISSGIRPWEQMSREILKALGIPVPDGASPIQVLESQFDTASRTPRERYLAMYSGLASVRPSRGYYHVAQLAAEGYITTILTTNWDALLEQALYAVLPADQVKVLIRGEVDDDRIAHFLAQQPRQVVVVKLHGDLGSRVLHLTPTELAPPSPNLERELHARLSGHCLMVGQSARDKDTIGLLLGRDPGSSLYYVLHHPERASELRRTLGPAGVRIVTGSAASVVDADETVDLGDFDDFFTQLNLAVHLRLTNEGADALRSVERAILDKERSGLGYINYTKITEMIQRFTLRVVGLEPDLVLFVRDPSAMGGTELRRRMTSALVQQGIEFADIEVAGDMGSRTFRRAVRSDPPPLEGRSINRILILDAITFSGNTMRLTTSRVREWFPEAHVRFGALVASQHVAAQWESLPDYERPIYETLTDRYEIFFPWGMTQTTADFRRRFETVEPGVAREIKIGKRPWGAVETLSDQEMTSVRLLTIEAHDQLSFQRHLCRDELIVALDDNVGLDICCEDLSANPDLYDPRIKSMVLEKGDYLLIPRGIWHRIKASMDRVRLLEVAFGVYDEAHDVQRLWDKYRLERKEAT